MPDFDKKTGNTANLQGSEFYGYGNQFESPLTRKSFLEKQQKRNIDILTGEKNEQIEDKPDNVHWGSGQVVNKEDGERIICDAYGHPPASEESKKAQLKTPNLSTRGGSGGGLFG
tara:strand:+ start:674 stop:1018 length:345 start_codon:yes stop_codon:yes gene_type:complete